MGRALTYLLSVLISIHLVNSPDVSADSDCSVYLTERSASEKYPLKLGGEVQISLPEQVGIVSAYFLGRNLRIDGTTKKFAFFVPSQNKIHVLRESELEILQGEAGVEAGDLQPIVAGIKQEDGTCAAFSIFNCMRQMHHDGNAGNGKLAEWMKDEPGRMRLLTRALHDYYIDGTHSDGIEEVASLLGFVTYQLPGRNVQDLKDAVRKYSSSWPILLRFDVTPQMQETSYEFYDYKYEETYSKKLWLPNRSRFRKSGGGHMVMIRGSFSAGGQEYLIVNDPNWTTPRLWPMDELNHLSSARIRAWAVWEKK